MKYQFDFLLPLKLQKISCNLSYDPKILLTNQFAGFFTFDFFDLSILIRGAIATLYLLNSFLIVYISGDIFLSSKPLFFIMRPTIYCIKASKFQQTMWKVKKAL